MDWFESLFGFSENGDASVRRSLEMQGQTLYSRANGRSFGAGALELVSLQELRNRVELRLAEKPGETGRLKARVVTGDVRHMHSQPEYQGALFQVASQFNLLEMPSFETTPELGITGYAHDHTQGPACAMAAAAATVYRNYFVPVGDAPGQTADQQLNGLADLGAALSQDMGLPVSELWTMRNGYALCTQSGLNAISTHLAGLSASEVDSLRGLLRIGVHRQVQVTDTEGNKPVIVSQAFCSALPVAYSRVPLSAWGPFAKLVLEAAYEATLLAGLESSLNGGANIVLLTRLGGGAFGNEDAWIHGAIRRALHCMAGHQCMPALVQRALRGNL
jgi:hypothetical protein